TPGEPARDGGTALREAEGDEARADEARAFEHLGIGRVEEADVVLDLGLARLARHPRRADAAVRLVHAFEVESGEPLRRDDQPVRSLDGAEGPEEVRRVLAVTVTCHPDLLDRAARIPEDEVASRSVDGERVLVHRRKTKAAPTAR